MSEKKRELTEEELRNAAGGALSGAGGSVSNRPGTRRTLTPGSTDPAQENPRDRDGEDPTLPGGGGLTPGDTGPTRG